jgi:hypothetical protein
MTARVQVAAAPNFHLPGALAERLLVADGGGWRPPTEGERAAIAPQDVTRAGVERNGLVLLFALPVHLRSSLWTMLEQGETGGAFGVLASEVGRFLTFKQLIPPKQAVIELVLQRAGGVIEPSGLWAAINMGDGPVAVSLPGLRLLLGTGEGCQLPEGVAAQVLAPSGEVLDVLLVVRRPTLVLGA